MASDNVHCLVVEAGAWTIDGVSIEAQTYNSTLTDDNNSWVGQAQSYLQSYTSPVVFGQVMTENDADWSVFWDRSNARQNPPSNSLLFTGKHVGEDTDNTRAAETVGFIVIEAGHGSLGGVEFEAAVGVDSIRGIGNGPPFDYVYNGAFAGTPFFTLATQAAMDGDHGSWAYVYGNGSNAGALDLAVDEDQIADSERRHTTEQLAYISFAGQVVVP